MTTTVPPDEDLGRPGDRAPEFDDDAATDDPAVIVDERLRTRRMEVDRAEGRRRRLLRLGGLVAVGVVAVVVTAVLRSPMFDVDVIAVEGASRTEADEVRAISGLEIGEPILLADLGGAADAAEALPWVADARARRDGLDTITIEIVERQAAAVLAGRDGTVLVDTTGQVLSPASGREALTLVHVVLDGDVPAVGAMVPDEVAVAVQVADRVRTDVVGAVAEVTIDPLTLHLTDGGVVHFGSPDDLEAKLESLQTLFARIDTTCLASVDLTVAAAPAVSRDPEC